MNRLAQPKVEGLGGLVRSLSDGNDELLIKRKGFVCRYLIAEDGSSQLLSEHPPPPHYEWAGRLFFLGVALAVFGTILFMALPGGPHLWAAGLWPVGFAVVAVGARCSPKLERHTQRGERWQKIGDRSLL